MKKLNQYIIEKFKISKDIGKNDINLVKEGEECYLLDIDDTFSSKYKYEINLPTCKCKPQELLEDKISYNMIYDNSKYGEKDKNISFTDKLCQSYINKNGYYQIAINNFNAIGIFLPKNQYIKFIKDIYPTFDENKEYELFSFPNNNDINKNNIEKYFDLDDIGNKVDLIKLIKDYKEISTIVNYIKEKP